MPTIVANIDSNNVGYCPFLNWGHLVAAATTNFAALTTAGGTVSGLDLYAQSKVSATWQLIDITGATQWSQYFYTGNLATVLPNFTNQAMTVDWAGQTVSGVAGNFLSNIVTDLPNKKATFTMQANTPTSYTVALAITPAQGDGSPPTNIRIYKTANAGVINSGQLMDPDWISFYSRFGILRLMDCMNTNGGATANPVVNYADFATTSDAFWAGYATTTPNWGWPVACLIEIANRTGKPIWINIPHQMTNAAVASFAAALAAGITYTGNEVRLYVEYTNEFWNSGFYQEHYMSDPTTGQGNLTSATDAFGYATGWETGGNDYGNGQQWGGRRAAQHMEAFRTAFGADSGTKWAGVLATWGAVSFQTTERIIGVNYHIQNASFTGTGASTNLTVTGVAGFISIGGAVVGSGVPANTTIVSQTSGTTGGAGVYVTSQATTSVAASLVSHDSNAPTGTTATKLFSYVAVAPYIGPAVTDVTVEPGLSMLTWAKAGQATFNANFYAELAQAAPASDPLQNVAQLRVQWLAQKALADAAGFGMIMYEGGYGSFCTAAGADGDLVAAACLAFSDTPQCGQLTYDMFTLFTSDTGGICSQYTPVGGHSRFGPWGARQTFADITQRTNAIEAFNQSAPWQQNYRNMQVVLTAS